MSLSLANTLGVNRTTTCEKLQLCLTQTECWDANDETHGSTANCFRIILALMSCGTCLVAIAEVQGRKKQFKEFKKLVQKARTRIEDTIDNLSHSFRASGTGLGGKDEYDGDTLAMMDDDRSIRSSASRQSLSRRPSVRSLLDAQQNHPDDASSVHGTMVGQMVLDDDAISFESSGAGDGQHKELELAFVTTFRTEGNFIKNNTDPTMKLPSSYSAEYAPRGVEQTVLPVSGFFFAETLGFGCNLLISVYLGSIGWAMLCSGFASLLWILVDYEKACYQESYIQDWIQAVGDSMTLVRVSRTVWLFCFVLCICCGMHFAMCGAQAQDVKDKTRRQRGLRSAATLLSFRFATLGCALLALLFYFSLSSCTLLETYIPLYTFNRRIMIFIQYFYLLGI